MQIAQGSHVRVRVRVDGHTAHAAKALQSLLAQRGWRAVTHFTWITGAAYGDLLVTGHTGKGYQSASVLINEVTQAIRSAGYTQATNATIESITPPALQGQAGANVGANASAGAAGNIPPPALQGQAGANVGANASAGAAGNIPPPAQRLAFQWRSPVGLQWTSVIWETARAGLEARMQAAGFNDIRVAFETLSYTPLAYGILASGLAPAGWDANRTRDQLRAMAEAAGFAGVRGADRITTGGGPLGNINGGNNDSIFNQPLGIAGLSIGAGLIIVGVALYLRG